MIGIIGTAGRGEDVFRLSARSFTKMGEIARTIIEERLQVQCHEADLISGGAAWADHVAAHAFVNGCGQSLSLALPCGWDDLRMQFVDNGSTDWRKNPGATANRHHLAFSARCGINSLEELHQLITERRADVLIGTGFHERNTFIAESADALIAFTFGNGVALKDGGTADTMGKFLKLNGPVGAFHVDLNTWEVYDNPVVP